MREAPRAIIVTPPRKKWQRQKLWTLTVRTTATLLLVIFITVSLHGHWPLALALTCGGLGFWWLDELWQRRCEWREILEDVDAMPYREFLLYASELLRIQGYNVLQNDNLSPHQAALLLSRGKMHVACWIQHERHSVEVKMIAEAAAALQANEGWRVMLLSSQRVTLRSWYRLRREGCIVINRDRLAHLVTQYRRGHRVFAFPRTEKTGLRRRK